jgi:hypothetical protein
MAEPQVNISASQLQELLAAAIKAGKEPTALEQAKLDKERARIISDAKSAAELAKTNEVAEERKWQMCPHVAKYNGRIFNEWCGQVCSGDNMVRPVCNICHVEAPMFSATLLPDGGKQGVDFEHWTDFSKDTLAKLHQMTFPNGCDRAKCFVCKKKVSHGDSKN